MDIYTAYYTIYDYMASIAQYRAFYILGIGLYLFSFLCVLYKFYGRWKIKKHIKKRYIILDISLDFGFYRY